jgi:hypothetical protein
MSRIKPVLEWMQAAAVIIGAVSTLFVFASGAIQKINSVPKLQSDLHDLEIRVANQQGQITVLEKLRDLIVRERQARGGN